MASALLCLESSGNLCSVAVTGFDREAYLQSEPGQNTRKIILGMIRGCLTAAGGSREGLQGIAFGSGPAPLPDCALPAAWLRVWAGRSISRSFPSTPCSRSPTSIMKHWKKAPAFWPRSMHVCMSATALSSVTKIMNSRKSRHQRFANHPSF